MSPSVSRRKFIGGATAGGLITGLGDLGILGRLPLVSAAEAKPDPDIVRFRPEIEPTVRLIEDTPQNKLIEAVAERVRSGKLSYKELLGALLLAGVRNVQPRPSVGFKFHAVLVVNSAHVASMASPDSERWLPIFWALDEFKKSQARDVREGNWTMAPVDEARVPPAHKARRAFIKAMDSWDVEAVDAAAAGLARHVGANEVFELFARYAARDFRSIGHKAIFVANSWRTLQCIGWQHAEPVLRSLAYALLNHRGEANPTESDHAADRPWRENEALARKLAKDWRAGSLNPDATSDLLGTFRSASPSEAHSKVVELLGKGIAAQSVYDAILVGSGELLMRQPGIIALHAMTSTNAIRYIYETTSDDLLRRRLLLQNAAFVTLFRDAMHSRGKVTEGRIDELAAAEFASNEGVLDAIFADIGKDRNAAARKLFGYLDGGADPKPFIDGARRLIFLKGWNSHDYKFSSAVLEDFYKVSPAWRNRYLATSVYNLRGSTAEDNGLVKRTREALKG